MEQVTIEANGQKVINQAKKIVVDGLFVYVKGLEGNFITPFATDTATVAINGVDISMGSDGYVFAQQVKGLYVDVDPNDEFDHVYEIYVK